MKYRKREIIQIVEKSWGTHYEYAESWPEEREYIYYIVDGLRQRFGSCKEAKAYIRKLDATNLQRKNKK
jgi:hypothetical protein